MHPTYRQLKFYILYCITQLVVWFFWASDWKYYDHIRWSGLHTSDYLTFTTAIAIPFLLGLLVFSIIFLPFYAVVTGCFAVAHKVNPSIKSVFEV